jgi:isopentenyl-diphosphate Delta-isomerase
VTTALREPELIVLVDEAGRPIGSAEKSAAHHSETPLHLAFSCYLFDRDGSFLVTRRASSKKVWPGVWSNSVCGHPAPGETMPAAVARGLRRELGMTARDLEVVLPGYSYKAPPFRGIVEHELCPVYVARAEGEPRPNPLEVEAWRWVSWPDFVRAAEADTSGAYSWWCKDQLKQLRANPLIAAYANPASATA